jgi:hypothetical protein
VQEYDKKSLYPLLVKCYEHLHLFVKSFAHEDISCEDCNLDIFEQIASTNEPTKEPMKRELLLFKHYQLDIKEINSLVLWWKQYETMFLTIWFFNLTNFKYCWFTN